MEVITPSSLKDALSKFKSKGDARWVDESELEESLEGRTKGIVDEYLENSVGLSDEDIDEILNQ